MSADREHPRLLLWYVTGDLEEEQAKQVESHVRWCPACRTEAQALSNALKALRRDPSVQGPPAGPGTRAAAEPSSRGWRDPGAGARSQATGREGWPGASALIVAAAAGFALALGPSWMLFRQRGPEPSIREVRTLALSPPQRGHSARRIAAGEGPYAVTLVLPLGAPEGSYHVRIEREDGAPSRLESTASTHGDGTINLLLYSSPPPGRYVVLVRELDEGGAGTPYVYPFEVASGEVTRLL